ncbi:MAG: TonB-dependent receptor, partial [Bacteroidia bacterium]|nr:TonB-dependent receptor [Bacteroidia bacterium]
MAYRFDSLQSIKINYLGDWGKNIGYPALPMDVGKATAQIMSLKHQRAFKGKRLEANELKVYYNSIYHQMDDTHREDVLMHMDMPGWSSTYGFYDNLSTRKGFNLRVDYHHTETRADMVMYPIGEPTMYLQTLPENALSDLGLAMKKHFSFKHKQQLDLNARLDVTRQYGFEGPGVKQWAVFNKDITETKQDLLKNGNIRYGKFFGERLLAQLSVGYGERLPTSNERYGYYLFNRQDLYDYVGNMDLSPERSVQSEFTLRYAHKKLECSANVFYHQTYDYIYAYRMSNAGAMTPGALGLKTYTNILYASSRGTELTLKYNINDRFTYMGTGKYVYAITNTGAPLPLVPPFKLQQALRCKIKLTQMQLEYDYAATQNRINPDYGDRATPDYHLFNFRVSRNFRMRNCILQATAACENIFDVRYREHLDIGQVPRFGRGFSGNISFLF